MGWASGSGLMSECIKAIKRNVPHANVRERIYAGMIEAFEQEDCDTLDECSGEDSAFDKALRAANPDAYGEEE